MIGNALDIISVGQSLPFSFEREDPIDWTCTIKVLQYAGGTVARQRVVALDQYGQWTGFLTSAETDALDPGLWRITAQLQNGNEVEVQVKRFQLNEAWDAVSA